MTEFMTNVPVNNPELLEILNGYPKLRDYPQFQEHVKLISKNSPERNRGDYFTGNEYLKEILDQGMRHEGFPDHLYGYNFKISNKDYNFFEKDAPAIWRNEITKKLIELNDKMMDFLSTRNNALACIYPPGGYISWHNNWNAHGYNFIFTWSETGDGFFEYLDPITKKVVVVHDVPGWQCKAMYFGNPNEPERVMYHAAKTNCWRCTVSYIFSGADIAKDFRQEIIEDISS